MPLQSQTFYRNDWEVTLVHGATIGRVSVGIRVTVDSLLVDEEVEKRITADPLEGRLEAIVGPG